MIGNVLPIEILQLIFRNLKGSEVLECCKVCRRWEEAVLGLSDGFWKEICAREHSEVYEVAYRKASLTWCELYVSLNLWSDVANADANLRVVPNNYVKKFQVLSDGVLACPYSRRNEEEKRKKFAYDTLIYYDMTTLDEICRECYTFTFLRFEESKYFIILSSLNNRNPFANFYVLHVILKSNRKHFVFRRLLLNRRGRATWLWIQHENEIYFPSDRNDQIYRLRLVEKDSDCSLDIEYIRHSEKHLNIKAVTKINSEQTNIFNADCQIFSLIGKELKHICRIDLNNSYEDIKLLNEYGFKGRCLNVNGRFPYIYGKLLIFRTINLPLLINIYYDDTNKIDVRDMLPAKSISLEELKTRHDTEQHLYVDQMDIVETLQGHRIIVSFHTNSTSLMGVCAIELSHKRV